MGKSVVFADEYLTAVYAAAATGTQTSAADKF